MQTVLVIVVPISAFDYTVYSYVSETMYTENPTIMGERNSTITAKQQTQQVLCHSQKIHCILYNNNNNYDNNNNQQQNILISKTMEVIQLKYKNVVITNYRMIV